MVITATEKPTEQVTLLFSTEQLARIAAAAARDGKTIEEHINACLAEAEKEGGE